MFSRKRKASSSEEPGKTTASLSTDPANRQRSAGDVPADEGQGRSRQGLPTTMQQSPSTAWQGSQLGLCCPLALLSLHWELFHDHHQPCPSASMASTEQDPGDNPQGCLAQRSSRLLTFALFSSACMLCGRADDDPNIFGRTFGQGWIRVHEFCLVSSSKGSFQLPATDAPFLSGLMRSCTFLSYRFLQLAFMMKEPHGRELVGSLFMLSDAQPSMQIRR